MDVVSTHRVEEVGVLVDDVLIVEEELVRLEQLLLLDVQHVLLDVVAHDVVVLHVVVRDSLPSEHDQVVIVDHVESDEPNSPIGNRVQNNPAVALDI